MRARAITHGAISIVNAIAVGKGAALGIGLSVEATVSLAKGSKRIEVKGPLAHVGREALPEVTVREVLKRYGAEDWGGEVEIRSEIPPSRGLKSSSAVSNAVALASMAALGQVVDEMEAVKLGVEASLKAGVTITGAFDDATASFFGGIAVTDNEARKVLRRESITEPLEVLLLVPDEELPKSRVDVDKVRRFGFLVEEAVRLVVEGRYWAAMTINGLIHASVLGFSTQPIVAAISQGALAAGLSGTGPAFAALCRPQKTDAVMAIWSNLHGRIVKTVVNNQKATVVRG